MSIKPASNPIVLSFDLRCAKGISLSPDSSLIKGLFPDGNTLSRLSFLVGQWLQGYGRINYSHSDSIYSTVAEVLWRFRT